RRTRRRRAAAGRGGGDEDGAHGHRPRPRSGRRAAGPRRAAGGDGRRARRGPPRRGRPARRRGRRDRRGRGVMREPYPVPAADLPKRVTIYEVGPRDGLQNEKEIVPVEVKLQFLDRLVAAGLTVVEATSLVRPEWVPQLADAEELLSRLTPEPGVRYPVLVPNERGLERALRLGVTEIAIFASATETFARRNLNRSMAESMKMFAPVVE